MVLHLQVSIFLITTNMANPASGWSLFFSIGSRIIWNAHLPFALFSLLPCIGLQMHQVNLLVIGNNKNTTSRFIFSLFISRSQVLYQKEQQHYSHFIDWETRAQRREVITKDHSKPVGSLKSITKLPLTSIKLGFYPRRWSVELN